MKQQKLTHIFIYFKAYSIVFSLAPKANNNLSLKISKITVNTSEEVTLNLNDVIPSNISAPSVVNPLSFI